MIKVATRLLVLFGVAVTLAAPGFARDLTLALHDEFGGPGLRDTLGDLALRPFTDAGGPPVATLLWTGDLEALKPHLAEWDLVSLAAVDAQAGCDQGLFEKLDWAALGGRDHYSPLGANDCAVGAFAFATVLAWDHDKFQTPPTWADFWDVAKYPGKRGLAKSPRGDLEIALMADGVAPGDVYRTLRGADGVARAYRKLDQLKPYLVFWANGAEAARLFGSGEVLMTSAPTVALLPANRDDHRSLAIQWAGNLLAVESWAIPKGGPQVPAATKLLAALGDVKVQSKYPAALGLGGFARGANDGLPPEQQALSPTLPANLDKGLVVDEAFWRENHDKLSQQFDAWLAR